MDPNVTKVPGTFELLRGGVCNELEVFKEYQVLKHSPFHIVRCQF